MEEVAKSENHLQSAAAFVEGGIQEACDDACSICLEEFCENDPSTVTGCKHEFHLQCILEWCQRSSQCPMCWQSISLKDPLSQELLDAIEQEKNLRMNPPRNTTIFHHPTLGDFELQHLPGGATDAELEERIIQHLAAAAAMGRARQIARREGQRSRSSAHGRPHYLVFSPNATAPNASPISSSPYHGGEGEADPVMGSNSHFLTVGDDPAQQALPHATQADHFPASASGSSVLPAVNNGSSPNNQRSPTQASPTSQDRAGPSEFQSFSESLKSRFNSMSTRYKESITKSTRGWKERLFARNNNVSDLSSDVRREVNAGIASVSSMMERLEARDDDTTDRASISSSPRDNTAPNPGNQQICEAGGSNSLHEGNVQSSHAAGSA